MRQVDKVVDLRRGILEAFRLIRDHTYKHRTNQRDEILRVIREISAGHISMRNH